MALGLFGFELGNHIGVETFSLACLFVTFGGLGLIIENWILTSTISLGFTIIIHFLVIAPLRKVQSSTSISRTSHVGSIATVVSLVPAKGFGEILMNAKLARSNQIASSFDGEDLPVNTRVVVVSITSEGVYQVSKLN
ncbi:hypothetical protein K0U00_00775 [Paenibacillus sepulcri]|uniref:NfeD-like C-terminal domain-containing protein n=1 Tax=Paenibacillus sepulcri TaxID=359917 RepID=A0ABS7BVA8_9BACL|nr:hypothetical protein [Paenibacillus sepulcri]